MTQALLDVSHAAQFPTQNNAVAQKVNINANFTELYAANPGTLAQTNGQQLQVKVLTELTTIAAAASTTTTIQVPAGAIVLAVSTRVVTAIPTAATFTVGDSGSAARYNTGSNVAVAAGTTDKGTKAGAYYASAAVGILITPNLTPAAATGQVRVTIHYIEVTPPTS